MPAVDVIEAIEGRASTRAFLQRPVERALIECILTTARWAPSGGNLQPWRVAVLTGTTKQRLGDALSHARAQGLAENPDYRYYPAQWRAPYSARRKACGLALYSALGIDPADKERRLAAWQRNYRFFDAPVGLVFLIDADLAQGSWLDYGMFLQSLMLAAHAHGLATCPQASLAEYPDMVRSLLGLPADQHVVCGMSLGYPDPDHALNRYRTDREPLANFTAWYG